MKRRRFWLPVLLLAAGCAGTAQFDETDNRRSVDADLGTSFSVSLPDPANLKARVLFSPAVLELTRDARDEAAGRRLLSFAARASGETEIKVGADYVLRVRVVSGADRPGMHINTH